MSELMELLRAYRKAEGLAAKVGLAGEMVVILRPRLFGYIWACWGEFHRDGARDVEDVLQEVLIAIVLRLDTFRSDSEGAFMAWCCAIARHKAIDLGRKMIRESAEVKGDDEFWEVIEASAKYEPISNRDRQDMSDVLELLRHANPCERRYVVEHFLHGSTFPEIAEAEGKKPDAIRMSVDRCLRKLKKSLGEEGR